MRRFFVVNLATATSMSAQCGFLALMLAASADFSAAVS